MEILPILSALRRNRVGAILIGIQIALTLAIVCNSLSIIQDRMAQMKHPSGVDEANIFTLGNKWVEQPADVEGKIRQDLAVLRSTPGVIDATASNSFPLRGGGWSNGVKLQPDQKTASARTTLYFSDEHTLTAWGLHLVAGRWFTADEIIPVGFQDNAIPKVEIVSRALAKKLFPGGDALGKSVYLDDGSSTQIIGIVDTAITPWTASEASFAAEFLDNATFIPFLFKNNGLYYIVRTQPGRQAEVMHGIEQKLFDLDRSRVIDDLRTFSDTRARIYRSDRALGLILTTVCALLLVVTAFGIVGLTTYWVAQRRRQIGVRRALGARRADILRYFQTENFLIAGGGAALGICLAIALNLWLVTHLATTRMGLGYVGAAAVIVLALSQAASIFPALRAASLPPAMATRNV